MPYILSKLHDLISELLTDAGVTMRLPQVIIENKFRQHMKRKPSRFVL